jgi:nucleotide-binding universal stress UspA family protein
MSSRGTWTMYGRQSPNVFEASREENRFVSIAKIIAPLTGAKRDSAVLATAFAAAKPFNAHVVALLVRPDPRLSVPAMGAPLSPQIMQNMINATEELNQAAAKAARAALEGSAAAAGAAIVDRLEKRQTITCSWQEAEGFFADVVARTARLSDLVVFGPLAMTDGADLNECFVDILTKTDRPVLLSAIAPAKFANDAAIAWDGGAPACHAVMGAMPFLKRAQSVTILRIGADRKEDDEKYTFARRATMTELRDYLALHGVTCNERVFERGTKNTGEALLDAALSCGANLLVMGGYGHSHLREAIFGGVTAHIRWNAELPVLMVH